MDTKTRIIATATRHFGERGYEAASLRDIAEESKVNSAATFYHFRSKQALYHAVISRFFGELSKARLAGLTTAAAARLTREGRIKALIRAYVEPHVQLARMPDGIYFQQVMSRLPYDPSSVTRPIYAKEVEPVRAEFMEAFYAALPNVNRNLIMRAFGFMVAIMIVAPLDPTYETLSGQSATPKEPNVLVDMIVEFAFGGFELLVSAPSGGADTSGACTAKKTRRKR